MKKTIRHTLPRNISLGILILIFVLVYLLAGQLFKTNQNDLGALLNGYLANFLVSTAVLIMVLILWEELLFPVNVKQVDSGYLFHNHRTKLKFQFFLYLTIPLIVVFLFLTYKVSEWRFFSWAFVVVVFPVVGKLISGIKNYNDFLQLTSKEIAFKDNDHEGVYELSQIQKLALTKDDSGHLNELILQLKNGEQTAIKVYQMELDDFIEYIEKYVNETYRALL